MAARREPVSEGVPYAFEQRIMARLGGLRPLDTAVYWARALWRAAAVCLAVSVLAAFWSLSTMEGTSVTLETAVLSAVDELSITW